MSKFVFGAILGLVLGVAGTAGAAVEWPRLIGGNGWLTGVDVTIKDGPSVVQRHKICSDPWIWAYPPEIMCE
jgi:hypothetical protein